MDTDDQRQLPTRDAAVPGTPYDFAEPRRLEDGVIDHAFGDLPRDEGGRAWLALTGAEPLTAPPNAFQTGRDVLRLEPGDSVTNTWARTSSERPPLPSPTTSG